MNHRERYFDILRGIAIICVVTIHSLSASFHTNTHTTLDQFNYNFGLISRALVTFAVPLFIFVSGYWTSQKAISSFHDYLLFLKKKVLRVLIPYLFWSTIAIIMQYSLLHRNLSIDDIANQIFTGGALTPYYFIILIIQLYLIYPLIQLVKNLRFINEALFIINISTLAIITLIEVFLDVQMEFPFYGLSLFMWVYYFYLGIRYRERPDDFPFQVPRIWYAVITSFLLTIIEAYFILFESHDLRLAISTAKVGPFLYSLAVIIFLVQKRSRIENSIFARRLGLLGIISFGIFFIHDFIRPPLQFLLSQIHFISGIQPVYQMASVLILLVLSIAAILATEKIFPVKVQKKIFGFK